MTDKPEISIYYHHHQYPPPRQGIQYKVFPMEWIYNIMAISISWKLHEIIIHITFHNQRRVRQDGTQSAKNSTGKSKCKVEIFQHMMTGPDGPRIENFIYLLSFSPRLWSSLEWKQAYKYSSSLHTYLPIRTRENFISQHISTLSTQAGGSWDGVSNY